MSHDRFPHSKEYLSIKTESDLAVKVGMSLDCLVNTGIFHVRMTSNFWWTVLKHNESF